VEASLSSSEAVEAKEGPSAAVVEHDPAHKLLVECNQLAVDIDNEIVVIHNFIRDKYRPKFPELESLVREPLSFNSSPPQLRSLPAEEQKHSANASSAAAAYLIR
jgi:U4/U6 small nuclear ribonucleoprotein PRP31